MELIDGGFVHNSPVEAAALWEATHLVLIEASPEGRDKRDSFLGNLGTAFSHLYHQAQRIDLQKKEDVIIFTLRPEPPHLCPLDFARNLVEAAIEKGYREAGEATLAGQSRFRKEPGKPIFKGG